MWRYVIDIYGNLHFRFTAEKFAEYSRLGIPIASFNPETMKYEPNEYFKELLDEGRVDYLVTRSEMEAMVRMDEQRRQPKKTSPTNNDYEPPQVPAEAQPTA